MQAGISDNMSELNKKGSPDELGRSSRADGASDDWQLLEHLPYELNAGIGHAAKIGMLVLSSDYTIDYEFRQVFVDDSIGIYQTRIENSPEVTPQTLAAMEQKIPAALKTILPGESLDVVAYCCTSASTVLGEQVVFDRIAEVQPRAKTTTPITAAFAAFKALSAKRIAVLTPYRSDVNQVLRQYIVNAGFEVPVFGSFNQPQDPLVARIDVASLKNAIERLVDGGNVDLVFVSCTSIRLLEEVKAIESKIGLPVTTSNHAMAWHCLRLAGAENRLPHLGSLFEKPLLD